MSMDVWYELLIRELTAFDQAKPLSLHHGAVEYITDDAEEDRPASPAAGSTRNEAGPPSLEGPDAERGMHPA